MFHSKDGWYFERQDDGAVRIVLKTWDDASILEDVTIDASMWASVVSSMSADGENGETWRAALDRQTSRTAEDRDFRLERAEQQLRQVRDALDDPESMWEPGLIYEHKIRAALSTSTSPTLETPDNSDEHFPWSYTEFGVLCACGRSMDRNEHCPDGTSPTDDEPLAMDTAAPHIIAELASDPATIERAAGAAHAAWCPLGCAAPSDRDRTVATAVLASLTSTDNKEQD